MNKIPENIEKKLNEEVNTTENEEGGGIVIRIKNTYNMKVIKVCDIVRFLFPIRRAFRRVFIKVWKM